jgi:hypothetical protein
MQESSNSKNPKYLCERCDYITSRKSNYEKHLQTEKHLAKNIATKSSNLLQKVATFYCKRCDFTTSNKKDYKRHCETLKCKSVTKTPKNPKKPQKTPPDFVENGDDISCDDGAIHSNVCDDDRFIFSKKPQKSSKQQPDDMSCVDEINYSNICDDRFIFSKKTPKSSNQKPDDMSCDLLSTTSKTYDESVTDYLQISEHTAADDSDNAHEMVASLSPCLMISGEIDGQKNTYECVCGKDFKTHSGLWRHHKRGCDLLDNKKILELVIKQHDETIVKIIEMVKDISKDKSIINNTNCHNKQFNLNFFLNETCKDAYNISEFVEQLDVSMEDMLNTSRVGYTEGVSQIIVNGLKALDENKRPIHCTDLKRETLYIKENNEWNKEAEDRPILLGAVKKIAGKNIKQISEWCKQHPNYRDASSRNNDIHLKMLVNVMQGGTDNEINNSFKTIFHNVATGTRIQKHY